MKSQLQLIAGKKNPDTLMENYNDSVKVLCLWSLIFANVNHCHLPCLLTLSVPLRHI